MEPDVTHGSIFPGNIDPRESAITSLLEQVRSLLDARPNSKLARRAQLRVEALLDDIETVDGASYRTEDCFIFEPDEDPPSLDRSIALATGLTGEEADRITSAVLASEEMQEIKDVLRRIAESLLLSSPVPALSKSREATCGVLGGLGLRRTTVEWIMERTIKTY